jgi:hypothetical protein
MSVMMENSKPYQPGWVDYLALGFSFFAVMLTVWAVIVIASYQTEIPGESLWPLPGLVLLFWVLLAIFGFISAYLCMKRLTVKWQRALWAILGTFIPLMILGAFSIGTLVFLVFLLFLITTLILSFRQRAMWLVNLGFLLLGGVGNLTLLLLIISLSNA